MSPVVTDRPRRFDVPVSLYPFEDRWLDRGGSCMHFVDTGPEGGGSDPTVLLLHGNPTWSFLYREVVSDLRLRHRCVAPDYPGFGLSDHPAGYGYTPREHAGWIGALVDELDLDDVVLVVHDWGGPIGLAVGLERIDRLAGIVLTNTWCWSADWRMRLFSRLMGGERIGRFLQLRLNFFVRGVMALSGGSPLSARVRAAYAAPFPTSRSRLGTWVFPREIRRSDEWLRYLEDGLGELAGIPVEIVWARRDPAFGIGRYLDRWRRHFPEARVSELPDAGHYLQEDRPDAVARAVRRVAG